MARAKQSGAVPERPVTMPRGIAGKARARAAGGNTERGSAISNPNEYLNLEDIRTLRSNMSKVAEAVRKVAKRHPIVSTAVFNLVQVAHSPFTVKAYDSATHQFSPGGTNLARSIVASIDTLYDYSEGFSDKQTMDTLAVTMLREVATTSAVACELVLDKRRFPDRIQVIPYETLKYKSKGDGRKYPVQQGVGEEVDLNIPTFWISELQKDASDPYSVPMLLAAIEMAFYFTEFVEDMRKVVRRSGHSRTVVTLDSAKVTAAAPANVRGVPEKMQEFMEGVRQSVETVVSSLEPEDALVTYDTASVDEVSAKGEKADYKDLLNALSGMLATSLKGNPSILGLRLEGSQSLSNTESLVYLKVAAAIQGPVQDVLSRALTLAARLYGADIYVRVKFTPINLRPEDELEAFKTMKQDRILRLLSLGLIADEEASEELGLGELPVGYKPLSGTMFWDKANDDTPQPSPNQDPQGRALQPKTPSKAGGQSQ